MAKGDQEALNAHVVDHPEVGISAQMLLTVRQLKIGSPSLSVKRGVCFAACAVEIPAKPLAALAVSGGQSLLDHSLAA